MTLGLVCDACDALSPVQAKACGRCGKALGIVLARDPALDITHVPGAAPPLAATMPAGPNAAAAMAPTLVPPSSPRKAPAAGAEHTSPQRPKQSGAASQAAAAPADESVVCPTCGTEMPTGHRFCGSCGTRLDQRSPDPKGKNATQYFSPMQAAGRARLVLIKGEGIDGVSHMLDGDDHIVGRRDGAIVFPEDALLSPKHASFYYREGHLMVRSYGRNGVYLRVKAPVAIRPEQPFLVGEQVLAVRAPSYDAVAGADLDGTYFYASPRKPSKLTLVQLLAGGGYGMVHRALRDPIAIGREGNDVNFPDDPFISGHHARLGAVGDGRYTLEDTGSKNGTYVRLVEETRLEHGDFLFVGQQLIRVEIS
jgi:pSer/pThr/pTyr-binding forkhead associated (FHA) protein